MAVSETSTIAVASFAGLAAATFFNVPLADLGAGTLIGMAGVAGRATFSIQRQLKTTGKFDGYRLSRWTAAGIVGTPSASVIVQVLAEMSPHPIGSGMIAAILFGIGFGGQDVVGPLWTKVAKFVNAKFGLSIEVDDDPPAPKT